MLLLLLLPDNLHFDDKSFLLFICTVNVVNSTPIIFLDYC